MNNKYINISVGVWLVLGVFFVSCENSTSINDEKKAGDTMVAVQSSSHTTQNVFSSNENVLTYDVIGVPTDVNWTTSVCKDDGSGSLGLNDSRWNRTDGQTASNIRPLLSGGLHAFETGWGYIHHPYYFGEADWINAVYERYSSQMNSDGQGHNWTRYEVPVDGNGTFELKLLADNCSWVYLDNQLVGYQDDAGLNDVNNTRYGVTLNGPATLTYIIFDGGGDAGGKFRLETTTEVIDPYVPPATENTAPVADAGTDQTLEATGSTTPVTLDGSGSTDADGDALTYSWSNGDTGVTTTANLGVGVHTFTLTVSDGEDTDSDDVTITVEDTTPPELSYSQVTGNLWPPNHKMVLVATGISALDNVDGSTPVDVTVSSNEPSNGKGDGNTDSDYEIESSSDGSLNVYVRAERSGKGSGRTYTVTMSSSDNAGNTGTASFEVSVAKSQGRR